MKNKTSIVPVRLRDDELAMLDHCCNPRSDSGGVGKLNRSELIRLLILREYRRRKTQKSVVANSEYSTDFRTGQPRKIQPVTLLPAAKISYH